MLRSFKANQLQAEDSNCAKQGDKELLAETREEQSEHHKEGRKFRAGFRTRRQGPQPIHSSWHRQFVGVAWQ